MNTPTMPEGGWNLFARVLQEILTAHGADIGELDDYPAVCLHKEKVRRLQKSIHENILTFPMLTTDEIERVGAAFHISEREKLRLRAAVLATAIEIILVNHINEYRTMTAAEEILLIVERAFQDHIFQAIDIITTKEGAVAMTDDANIDITLEGALTAIDRATLALTLSRDVDDHWERIDRLRQAERGFETALAWLDGATASIKHSSSWKLWHDEAYHNLTLVIQQLALHGG